MAASQMEGKFNFAIDRGGTFTDVWARCPDGTTRTLKLLSEDPANYEDAPREGIRRVLEQVTGRPHPASELLDTSQIEWIRMGTTVATNSLLERNGERMALVITKGFADLLYIGNQARPKIFDLKIAMPDMLYEEVIEVEERVALKQDACQLNRQCGEVIGTTGEKIEIWQAVNKEKLILDLKKIYDKGIRSIAVVLMHSYTFPGHEEQVGKLAEEIGFTNISLSSKIMPMVRIVSRGYTACSAAYLTPCIKRYIKSFESGFKSLENVRVLFMQSDGGLTPVENFCGSRAIVSGPAGGVVGYAMTTFDEKAKEPIIGFDMGGTSTDVSRFAGKFEHVFESTTAGVTIQAPQLDINTVAAGGGSRLFFRSGMFVVGPESARAHPGPVCYKKGGPLAVTDANLVLGRLLPEYFPKIFGPDENEQLDKTASLKEFRILTEQINEFTKGYTGKSAMTVEEVAMGFIRVANEAMCRPIRALTQAKGYDTSRHILACFGGAGGQHACAIARTLGMRKVFIHKHSGILSAYGLALADVVHEAQEPCASEYRKDDFHLIDSNIHRLRQTCITELKNQGFSENSIETEAFLHMRYRGTDCALMVSAEGFDPVADSCSSGDFKRAFLERYQSEFGFVIADRPIIVDDVRVRGVGKSGTNVDEVIQDAQNPAPVETTAQVYFEGGFKSAKVYFLENLFAGHKLEGPAVIIDKNGTILIEPDCEATITARRDVVINIHTGKLHEVSTELESIQLSIFSHRFMSTAEQMGRVLQRTSISTNIKERLDFSCAMFGPDGGLVANAPHIPVHLGAMQEAVQYQMRTLGSKIEEGDVLLSNHPCAGGSHLPDLTVITPVFYRGHERPVFFVASRGHHADIGGITPGSMPPNSTSIFEEGAVFKSFFLIKKGVFQEEELIKELNAPGQYPGSSGTRNLHDNLSDLRAQVAANQKGIKLIQELIDEYGLEVIQAYMNHIQDNAELAVRDTLREIAALTHTRTGSTTLSAEDKLDNGSKIVLSIHINQSEGSAVFDFTGTGKQMSGNLNAPRAVTLSAIIYCLRCLVSHDVPLNQGCLKPVKVIIPKGCLLDPSDSAAVVGGNVLTSQRVVDVIFKAFSACAASQGCMNNITFGDENVGYYETVAGGAGAGPDWDGRSGVHSHMTNTRITDPEILEKRYPVILEKFGLNPDTGGAGEHYGGDGIIREILFRKPLKLSILCERRVYQPYGLNGGEAGSLGRNIMISSSGEEKDVGGKASLSVEAGSMFRLLTPGGGGYGQIKHGATPRKRSRVEDEEKIFTERGSVAHYRMMQESA